MLLTLLLASCLIEACDDPPAIEVRLKNPGAQLARVLDLFQGTGVRDPAELLARWRRATGNPDVLGKVPQAAIAAFNRDMVREIETFDDTLIEFDWNDDGALTWLVAVPRDDGTLGALATALALTDGQAEAPLDALNASVDRLGRAGAPLLAQRGEQVVVAPTRDALARGFQRLEVSSQSRTASGMCLTIRPQPLERARESHWRRAARALKALGATQIDASARIEVDRFVIETTTPTTLATTDSIPRAWLGFVPDDASACFALSFDRGGKVLNSLFAALDPADSEASLRSRLNLLANSQGIFPEIELWPNVAGASGYITLDGAGRLTHLALALHVRDEPTAARLGRRLASIGDRLTSLFPGTPASKPKCRIISHRAGVIIECGVGADRERLLGDDPLAPMSHAARLLGSTRCTRFAALWPGRVRLADVATDTPLAQALHESEPIVWRGESTDNGQHDRVEWTGLKGVVRRLVDAIPQKDFQPTQPR